MPISRSKWQIIGSALGVFILGFLAGGFSLNLYRIRHPFQQPNEQRVHWRQFIDSLNLNADQKAQVDVIFSDTRAKLKDLRKENQAKVDEIRMQARDRLQAVLNADQWKKLQDQEKSMERPQRQGENGP